ncbi:MAG TPA: hypothetical protein DDZ80_20380 [Cyanobacteria bacterium UBA8803]|nr:hypothetical protein [Cyanobacteria bacterium UBA9273]HBL60707.1 hypothetical protein [Cyanobacteria bacterium UBA8803]
MITIRDVVKQAIGAGYLTVEAEERLRNLLTARYDLEDLKAFMSLQKAASDGFVRQQSREVLVSSMSIE